jgi:hypothetical protein
MKIKKREIRRKKNENEKLLQFSILRGTEVQISTCKRRFGVRQSKIISRYLLYFD